MNPSRYLPRAIESVLEARLADFPVVVVTGARQTGKSTLVRRVRQDDARHLSTFLEEYPDKADAGILLHTGEDTYWLTDKVLAAPWHGVV